ncbi:YibE/F family protein [Bombilactobacillus folatiphilus]|uniref:YibE/F family protein n=1 Tax=Bombilactobacillus folatiphilus TaxID=2923362 RepID=A0ABY4P904_9LACO|nr:YibE/F family protein [Bombilactobacillus folatiphilus]UQS82095.1 YibE/F family protein [Bombilactobacillus folatiphilus]
MIYLTGILLALLVLICGRQGLRIFGSLGAGFLCLLILIMLISDEFNPIVVGILFVIGLAFLAIYPNTQNPLVQKTAIVATLSMLLVVFGLTLLAVHFSFSHGFTTEDTEEIEQFVLEVGISFPQIQVVVILISSLGAIAEASIAVSSGVWEIVEQQPQIAAKQLWHAGLEIGRKNIATALNTLLSSFFGSYLTLGLWFIQLHYSLAKIFNNALLVNAALELMVSFGGVLGAVYLSIYYIGHQRRKVKV